MVSEDVYKRQQRRTPHRQPHARQSQSFTGTELFACGARRDDVYNPCLLYTSIIAYVVTAERISHENEEEAVSAAMSRLKGAYSCVLMFDDKLIALRDEHGFRPLCYGKTSDGSVIVASESCALDACGAVLERDLCPGEMLVIDKNGVRCV